MVGTIAGAKALAGMAADVYAAAAQTLSRPYRSILLACVGAAVVSLGLASILAGHVLGLAAVAWGAASWPVWASAAGSLLLGAGFLVVSFYLLAPIAALVAGLFADRLAELAEIDIGSGRIGRPAPWGDMLRLNVRFVLLALALNAAAFILWLTPGVNAAAFVAVNAYAFGRMTFETVALRHIDSRQARALFRKHSGRVVLYGVWIALLLAVPLLNLLTPLFAVSLMARAFDRIIAEGAAADAAKA